MPTPEEQFAVFDKMGETRVQDYLSQGAPEPIRREALAWLDHKRQERDARNEGDRIAYLEAATSASKSATAAADFAQESAKEARIANALTRAVSRKATIANSIAVLALVTAIIIAILAH